MCYVLLRFITANWSAKCLYVVMFYVTFYSMLCYMVCCAVMLFYDS